MDFLITEIFGRQALGEISGSSSEYITWAEEMLLRGHDSHALRILAVLDPFSATFEAEQYFLRSLKELDLSIPDSESAVRNYACAIAQRIIDGDIIARQAVRVLYRTYVAANYNWEFIIWSFLDSALDALLDGEYPYTYPSATLENFDGVAKKEAGKFTAAICSNS